MKYDVRRQYERHVPDHCAEVLSRFGLNPYNEPNFRVVWSESQFEWCGGVWEDHIDPHATTRMVRQGNMILDSNPVIQYKSEYRRVPKYPKLQCYVLERWLPCSHTPEDWFWRFFDPASGLNLNGPYPEHGEYHCSYLLQDRGQYTEPTADLIEYYARMIVAGQEYSKAQQKAALEEAERRQHRDWEQRFDDVWDDAMPMGGVTSSFHAMSGPKTVRKTVDDVKIVPKPSWLPDKGSRQI